MNWKPINSSWRSNLQESSVKSVGAIDIHSQAPPRNVSEETTIPTGSIIRKLNGTSFAGYAASLFFVAIALISSLLLRHIVLYPFPFLFFAAVMASAWFGGTGAGLFAVLASTATVDYFLIPPYHSFVIDATNGTYFIAFIVCAFVSSWVSAAKKKDEEALREARDQLELRVAERTGELQKSNSDLRKSIQQQEEAQVALMKTQAELTHLSRVLTMGELTASIAHEVNQPLTAVVTCGNACLEWLSLDPPNLEEARRAAETVIKDGSRAGAVLGRIRALFRKHPPVKNWLNINEVIQELAAFLHDEGMMKQISIRMELSPDLPRINGDRIQLQQVLLNLMVNAMEAMRGRSGGGNEIIIRTDAESSEVIRVSVEDCGVGFSAEMAEKIFDPFFTTKPEGTGMGLSISRSIVETHQGRLWAVPRPSGGAIFQFTIPTDT